METEKTVPARVIYRGHEITQHVCRATDGEGTWFLVHDEFGLVLVAPSLRSAKRGVADRLQRQARKMREGTNEDAPKVAQATQ